jgi:carbonic anhydrase/acetyltransferase-like protein (isoleucine patch superfamily)
MALILPYQGKSPVIHDTVWLAPTAVVTGDTEIGAESSIWFGTVVRGDVNWIRIGKQVNLQDGVICHVTIAKAPLTLEDQVSVGHAAVVHGCTLKRGCLIGIGARVLDHAVVSEQSLVAAGSVVLENTIIPPGELWAGVPAKKKRDLSPEEQQGLLDTAARYVHYRLHYSGHTAEIPSEWLPKK